MHPSSQKTVVTKERMGRQGAAARSAACALLRTAAAEACWMPCLCTISATGLA